VTVFDDLRGAMGDIVGSDALGGYILGILIVGLMFLAITFRTDGKPVPSVMSAMIAISFVVMVGWWDAWTIVFVFGMGIALLLRARGSEGGI